MHAFQVMHETEPTVKRRWSLASKNSFSRLWENFRPIWETSSDAGEKKQGVNQGMESFKRESVLVQKWESRRSEYPEGEIILRLPERKFKVILDSG